MRFDEYPRGATPLSLEEAEGLLVPGVRTREDLNFLEARNIVAGWDWARRSRGRDPFSEAFLLELHRRMFGDVWSWAGRFRTTDKNIGVSHWRVGESVRNLCEDARTWTDTGAFSPDEAAARMHHRLVWIHPFVNGNGRHARLWADFVLVRVFGGRRFSWGGESLGGDGAVRDRYLTALRAADAKDFGPLLGFVRG